MSSTLTEYITHGVCCPSSVFLAPSLPPCCSALPAMPLVMLYVINELRDALDVGTEGFCYIFHPDPVPVWNLLSENVCHFLQGSRLFQQFLRHHIKLKKIVSSTSVLRKFNIPEIRHPSQSRMPRMHPNCQERMLSAHGEVTQRANLK